MPSQQLRAERISEAKWNEWRVDLERLYQKEEASQKDIIEFIWKNHSKTITGKQLKYRFHKWGTKKNIPNQDMKVIIWLVREHKAHGNEITVRCKGYEVDRKRIERAMRKNPGPMPSPTSIPSYIEYQSRPHRMSRTIQWENPISSVQSPVESSTVGPSTPFTRMDEGIQPLISVGARPHVSQVPGSMDSVGDPGLVRSPGIFTITDVTSADTRVLSTTSPVDDHGQSMTSVDALSHGSLNSQGESIRSQTLEKTCRRNSDIDWLTAGTLSLGNPSLYRTMNGFPWSPENTPLQHGCSGVTLHSPPRLSTGLRTTQDGVKNFNIPLANARNDFQVLLPNGDDPEEIVTLLRLTMSHLLMSSDRTMLGRNFSRGSTLDLLRHLLCSGWLLNELENILRWSYEASARAITQRQLARNGALEVTNSKRPEIHNDNFKTLGTETDLHRRRSTPYEQQTKLTSAWSSHMPNGTLNLQLRTVTRQHLILDDKESPSVLELSSIPIMAQRTTGISAVFINPLSKNQGPRISPQIRTFNVVPGGSEITQCVQNNDLKGVQSLFDLEKASPSDVDPRGFSLLSYAIHNGCSDIFDLLVRTGAGIQNCKRFGSQQDAIWAIWSYFVNYNSSDYEKEHVPGHLGNLDECKRMTQVILAHGCDIEDTMGFSAQANVLFELCYHWPIDQAPTSTLDGAVEYLINIGYDVEKKNQWGQTALLWTASSYQPQVIKCLRAILRNKRTDLNAVDSAGRGVIHSALAVPHIFDNWRDLIIMTHGVHVTALYGLPHLIYRTESTAYASDYSDQVLESNPFAVQDYASLFGSEACLFQTGHYATTQEAHDSTNDISTTFNSAPTDSTTVEDSDLEEYVLSLDPHGIEHVIKNPIHVLKTRLKHKLLTLLQADCDPNLLDDAGASPSDYARRDGLWPQWSWALEQSGHIYDARNDRWVRIGRF